MGAIADFSAYRSGADTGTKFSFAATVYGLTTPVNPVFGGSFFLMGGSVPSTAAACDAGTVGALPTCPIFSALTAQRWLVQAESMQSNAATGYGALLYDRLSHQGGLSGIVATAQTTNLPTAALPRYTTGAQVWIGLEIYTAVGATATTVTANYTNQAGTAGRTTKAVAFGGSGTNSAGTIVILPLADGDTGVRSVESVTLAATTGTAGNFGVTLIMPLFVLPPAYGGIPESIYANGLMAGKMIELVSNACLGVLTKANGNLQQLGALTVIEA